MVVLERAGAASRHELVKTKNGTGNSNDYQQLLCETAGLTVISAQFMS